ncbi:MAG: peptide-methionine (S)-S-oxide reductase MsrA [Pseudomonadota bacterium]|nr:peptide-methionine (S)-S-oxide reductase MsrA [Pseudomonadota bacterium]
MKGHRFTAAVLLMLALALIGAARAEENEPLASAVFAGGCFWCMEPPFDRLEGVVRTTSGYAGGAESNPTYKQVASGGTGHAEVVEVVYDPKRLTYADLLAVFWRQVDPLDGGGQFCDRGRQYRPAIFVANAQQRRTAEASLKELVDSGRFAAPIAVTIEPLDRFWPAEQEHQDYYRRNPVRYKFYRWNCGRDARLESLWGTPAD